MKTFVSGMAFAILLNLSMSAQSEVVQLSGTYTGFNDGTMLYFSPVKGGVGTVSDSTTIIDGQFSISIELPESPTSMIVSTEKFKAYTSFWVEPGEISMQGTADKFKESKIIGSPLQEIDVQLMALKGEKKLPLIEEHIGTQPAIDALYWMREKLEQETLQSLYDKIPTDLQSYSYAKKIQSYLSTLSLKAPDVGDDFIDFQAFDEDGKSYQLSELNDKYVLLEFGSSFCGPCYKAVPEMSRIQATEKDRLRVVSFSLDNIEDNWRSSLERLHKQEKDAPILHLWDGEGDTGVIAASYKIDGMPTFYLINPKGVVVDKWMGWTDGRIEKRWEKAVGSL